MINESLPPDVIEKELENSENLMTWAGHLTELRSRLLKVLAFFAAAFVLLYPFSGKILEILMLPLAQAMEKTGGSQRVIFTGLAEGFVTHLKLAAFGAAITGFPYFAFQVWRFVVPGLYQNERRFVRPIFIASPVLFALGALFVFFALMPVAFRFLLSFQQLTASENVLPVVLEARLSEYLSFLMTLILAFGISFQLPVVLVVLGRLGIITAQNLKDFRRYAVVFIFVAAAVLTPPDVVSQLALAVPLLFLYESAVWCIQSLEKKADQGYK
ncbi:MAG: twin-arginine translocase subunit TatC [Alphaproteobacteria bacterium]|nr:twin-arginine translocase subunit TatC [Alphaproteobacteria bacterium]